MSPEFDLILVGTGFASSFFLLEYLRHAPKNARVLVLERGQRRSHTWQRKHGGRLNQLRKSSFINATPDKTWRFRLSMGGGSNCWWACTPRMLPEDFELFSKYGVGRDWPLAYDDLEEAYCDAEEIMQISGPADGSPFPRSRPYPQPPHGLSDPERWLKTAHPDQFFAIPTARPSRPTKKRPSCCNNSVCTSCPIDSKFTVINELGHVYQDSRVELRVGATVHTVEVSGSRATGVAWRQDNGDQTAKGDLVALGANALFNPWLLLRSGIDHPGTGEGLCEQRSTWVTVHLRGLAGLQGTSSVTGHGYSLYSGNHRRNRAAGLIETNNLPQLRRERGRWRHVLNMKVLFEDLPQAENRVTVSKEDPMRPTVTYQGPSPYLMRSVHRVKQLLTPVLEPLPVESITVSNLGRTEAHILSTTPMGNDPRSSVVDANLRHHRVRNLLVLGGSTFPSVSPANPTLTISALSLWAARALWK